MSVHMTFRRYFLNYKMLGKWKVSLLLLNMTASPSLQNELAVESPLKELSELTCCVGGFLTRFKMLGKACQNGSFCLV